MVHFNHNAVLKKNYVMLTMLEYVNTDLIVVLIYFDYKIFTIGRFVGIVTNLKLNLFAFVYRIVVMCLETT